MSYFQRNQTGPWATDYNDVYNVVSLSVCIAFGPSFRHGFCFFSLGGMGTVNSTFHLPRSRVVLSL